jgi:CRP/FNR family cyclic AMP-dependent transcriptional regulator
LLRERSSVRLLEADPDLGEGLSRVELATAERELVVDVGVLETGSWEPLADVSHGDRGLGLVVLDGLLAREVVVADTTCAELVGRGDVLRPWERFGEHAPLPFEVEWDVLERTQLAILDEAATTQVCRWPALTTALVARTVARVHALALSLAITCITGVKIRLLVLFWHLADRWGRVRPDGVYVPLRLTHETIGKLIGARRPSVSTALGELDREGVVRRERGGWLLRGDPPDELTAMHDRRRMTRSHGGRSTDRAASPGTGECPSGSVRANLYRERLDGGISRQKGAYMSAAGRTPAQLYSLIFGVVLIAAGVLGFIWDASFDIGPGVEGDDLIGLFEVNGWHNIIHIVSGIIGVAVAASPAGSRAFALGFGAVYAVVTIWGFITGDNILFGLAPVNFADNLLHAAIAIAGIAAGLASPTGPAGREATA